MSQNEYEERKPIIYLAGIGMGQDDQLTGEVLDCLDRADAVMGARRMLDAAAPYTEGKAVLAAYKPSEMVNWLSSFEWDEAVLVLSGDTGFYSGAEAASKAFLQEGWEVEYIPGVSSLSYFCARLGRSWQNVHSISSHGRSCDEALWKSCLRYCEKSSRRRDENLSHKAPERRRFHPGKGSDDQGNHSPAVYRETLYR